MGRLTRCGIVLFGVIQSFGAALAQNYRATELPGLPGAFIVQAAAINDAGVIVGASNTAGGLGYVNAVKWIDGSLIYITGTGMGVSSARGVSESGVVVGTSHALGGSAYYQADPDGPAPLTSAATSAVAIDINNQGVIAGTASSPMNRAVRWIDGVEEDLGSISGEASEAFAVNDAGVICGRSDIPKPPRARGDDEEDDEPLYSVAVIFVNGSIEIVADFGGNTSVAYDINNNGEVVGESYYPFVPDVDDKPRAFYWNGGEAIDLGTLGGGFSVASAINDYGVIVGYSDGRATRYRNGQMQDLNKYIVASDSTCVMHAARDVNNAGQIVASSSCGTARAFRLDPVIVGDVNIDGVVDVFDLFDMLGEWGACDGGDLCPADVNRDGVVDVFDLFEMLSNWSL